MMRKKHLKKEIVDVNRQKLAEYFGIEELLVVPYDAPGAYILDIKYNKSAQEKYKTMTKGLGNTMIPNHYDFDQELLVMWNDTDKPQAL